MNRSVLLVICDFFILTLLSFVKFDGPANEGPPPTSESVATRQVAAPALSNMVASLETALELERQQRDTLTNALAATSAELAERVRLLAQREQALTNAERRITESEDAAKRLADERARLEKAQGEATASVRELQRAFESARQTSGSLQNALTDSVREAAEAKARLAVMEEELNRRRQDTRAMQEQIARLDEVRDRLQEEKQQLSVELKETAAEARVVRQSVTHLTEQLAQSSAEKTKLIQTTASLATNVTAIAEQSSALKEQIERQTRLPANTIYAGYISNRLQIATHGTTRGGLGQEVQRRKDATTVLVRSGGRVHAVFHVEGSALRIWPPDAPWTALGVEVGPADRRWKASQFALARRDPRVVAVPVDEAALQGLGVRVYDVATDPAQFAEAVVIGTEEAYYGECAFRLSGENAGYLQMERSTIRRLLGEFTPRRGDIALSKTGAFLGVLVNGDHCLPFDRLEFLPAFRTGETQDVAANTAILRSAQATLEKLPASLK